MTDDAATVSSSRRHRLGGTVMAVTVDLVVIISFVAIGRRNHDEDMSLGGFIHSVTPFVIALAATWVIGRIWRAPMSRSSGVTVWVGTIVAGMVIRKFVFDDGTATAFVIVATVFLGSFLNGWRVLARFREGS